MVDQGYGRIVMTTSTGVFGLPHNLSYATAKGAVIGLTRSLATAGAAHGIKVNLIAPAAFTRMAGQPARGGRAWDGADAADVAGSRRPDGRLPRPRGLPGQRRDLRRRRRSVRPHLHRLDRGLCRTPTPEPTIEDVADNWATINDETGYYVPADLTAWSAAFMAHLTRADARAVSPPSDRLGPWTSRSTNRNGTSSTSAATSPSRRSPAGPRRPGTRRGAPPICSARWVELGLLGMLIPEEWGGIGMSTVGFVAAMEQIGLADQSVAAAWQAHVTIGSLPLYLFGNDAQRERWLRPLAEGRVLGAFGLTEPDAGSDARGIRTRAERHDGGWLINGRKTFISNAGTDMSFGVTLLARIEPAEGQKPRFASFVVEKGTRRLHHGAEDAGHRMARPRHPRAVPRRRLGARRPAHR